MFEKGNFIRVSLLICFFISIGCTSKKSDNSQTTPGDLPSDDGSGTSTDLKACKSNGKNSNYCFLSAKMFYYSLEYGGRTGLDFNSNILVNEGVGLYSLDQGMYSNTKVATASAQLTFSDNDLIPGNIQKGVTLFGVLGTMETAAADPCMKSGEGAIPSVPCSLGKNSFIYSTENNGRSALCDLTNLPKQLLSSCYINNSDTLYLLSTPTGKPAGCSTLDNPRIYSSVQCLMNNGEYVYNKAYNGRDKVCNSSIVSGTPNTETCWFDITGGTIYSIHKASEPMSKVCTVDSDGRITQVPCATPSNAYVYVQKFGGRTKPCRNVATGLIEEGLCYMDYSSFQAFDLNLAPDNLRKDITIFGVKGNFAGEGMWRSGAHRSQSIPSLTLTTDSIEYAGKSGKISLPGGYHEVPYTLTDDEGTGADNLDPIEQNIVRHDRSAWGSVTCGTAEATIASKISDCGLVFSEGAIWDGTEKGNASQVQWKLVSRYYNSVSSKSSEVWLDTATNLLWSSLVSNQINWCKAAGSHNISGNQYAENDPNDICDNSINQSLSGSALSACYENGSGHFSSSVTSWESGAKAQLSYASTPTVRWRIPTLYDYELAERHGVRFVLPDMGPARGMVDGLYEWTGTLYSGDTRKAWAFKSFNGNHAKILRTEISNLGVRCIGRAQIN
jgi:hypothetical protein